MMTNSSASVISDNLYDVFGVSRYEQGSAETPWRWKVRKQGEDSLVVVQQVCVILPGSNLTTQQVCSPGAVAKCIKKCRGKHGEDFLKCVALCLGKRAGHDWCVDNFCRILLWMAECTRGNPCEIGNPDVVDCQHCCNIKYYCCLVFNSLGTAGAGGGDLW